MGSRYGAGRARVGALAALCVLAACSGGDPAATDPTPSASPSGKSTPSGTSIFASPRTPAPTSAAASATSPSAVRPTYSSSPGSGPAAPPASAPATGRFPITVDGEESFGATGAEQTTRTYPRSSTMEVRRGESSAHRVFDIAYSPDRRDTLTLRFGTGGIALVNANSYVRVGSYQQSRDFTPLPSQILLPARAKVGQAFSGSFSGQAEGYYSGRVVRRERLVVGGAGVDTLVVDMTTTFSSGEVTGTIRTVIWWDVAGSRPVRETLDARLHDALTSYRQQVTLGLSRLTPSR